MALGTGIEWTDATWNVLAGCTPVSPGCLNCYAATMARRLEAMGKKEYRPRQDIEHTGELLEASEGNGKPIWERIAEAATNSRTLRVAEVRNGRAVFTGEVRCLPERLTEPLGWKKPRMVFVNSMSDLFHEAVPFEFIDRVFAVMALCPQHTFQVLTKRPERMAEYLSRPWVNMADGRRGLRDSINDAAFKLAGRYAFPTQSHGMLAHPGWPLPNVWLGTSVEDQARADARIPHLLRCPAAVRFLSLEPLLGAVDIEQAFSAWLRSWTDGTYPAEVPQLRKFLHWAICGGESGPHAREFREEWAESVRDQCADAGVPFFFKQYGSNATRGGQPLAFKDRKGADPAEWPVDMRVRQFPEVRR